MSGSGGSGQDHERDDEQDNVEKLGVGPGDHDENGTVASTPSAEKPADLAARHGRRLMCARLAPIGTPIMRCIDGLFMSANHRTSVASITIGWGSS